MLTQVNVTAIFTITGVVKVLEDKGQLVSKHSAIHFYKLNTFQ